MDSVTGHVYAKMGGEPATRGEGLPPHPTRTCVCGCRLPTCEARLAHTVIAVDAVTTNSKGAGVAGTIIDVNLAVHTWGKGGYCHAPLPNPLCPPAKTAPALGQPQPHLWCPEDSGTGICPPGLGIFPHGGRAGCGTRPPGSHNACPCSLAHRRR